MASRIHREVYVRFWREYGTVEVDDRLCLPHEIDNDGQRLKLLKASYDNQRYGLQDNFMIKYPKLIKTATEKLANVREDVKERDKELIDNPEFAITIGKATYTERVDGGTMMLEAISKCKTGETTAIGKFHGFELLVENVVLQIRCTSSMQITCT